MNSPLPVLPHVPLGFEDDKPTPAKEVARQYTTAAVRVLLSVALNSDDDSAKVKAAQAILDRGWGKPDHHQEQKSEVTVTINWIGQDRLSYLRGETVENAATPAAIESVPPAPPAEQAPWREPKPDTEASLQVTRLLDAIPKAK